MVGGSKNWLEVDNGMKCCRLCIFQLNGVLTRETILIFLAIIQHDLWQPNLRGSCLDLYSLSASSCIIPASIEIYKNGSAGYPLLVYADRFFAPSSSHSSASPHT